MNCSRRTFLKGMAAACAGGLAVAVASATGQHDDAQPIDRVSMKTRAWMSNPGYCTGPCFDAGELPPCGPDCTELWLCRESGYTTDEWAEMWSCPHAESIEWAT